MFSPAPYCLGYSLYHVTAWGQGVGSVGFQNNDIKVKFNPASYSATFCLHHVTAWGGGRRGRLGLLTCDVKGSVMEVPNGVAYYSFQFWKYIGMCRTRSRIKFL